MTIDAGDLTAPTYAEFHTCEERPTISSRCVRQPDKHDLKISYLLFHHAIFIGK